MKPRLATPQERICVALDVSDRDAAKGLTKQLIEYVGFFKVGFELFTSIGPAAVRTVTSIGGKVFLDLKYHDIPTTVAHATEAATEIGVSLLNLHASGGSEMMEKAVDAVAVAAREKKVNRPFLVAVTVLTSLDLQILNRELRITGTIQDQVVHLAKLAMAAGLDGVVASPTEVVAIREACGPECLIITPGVRPLGIPADDQRRIMTPKEAIEAGADILVVGRAITASPEPAEAAKRILDEIA